MLNERELMTLVATVRLSITRIFPAFNLQCEKDSRDVFFAQDGNAGGLSTGARRAGRVL